MNAYVTALALLAALQVTAAVEPFPALKPFIAWHRERHASSTAEWVTLEQRAAVPSAPQRIMNDSLGVAVTSDAALVLDAVSGAVLWEKNADEQRPIASITKLVGTLVALEYLTDPDAPVEIREEDHVLLGYNNFSVGEVFPVRDVLAAVIVASDNTAMRALARSTGLSAEEFVRRMNERVKALGLRQTRFADVTGLSDNNISTAREVSVFAREAFKNPEIARLAGRAAYAATSSAGSQRTIRTTDKLIGSSLLTVVAGKTGYVSESGYNIVADVRNNKKQELRTVILGSATNDDRFQDLKMLSVWAWRNYEWL